MSMPQSVKARRSMAMKFEYPKAQQVLYWLMKAAGYGRERWKGHTSQGSLQRISRGEWVRHDMVKEFLGEAINTLASLALCQDIHMEQETGTRLVEHVMDGFIRWDRMTQALNHDREIELTAPLGAVPILRMAAIQVGCTVGAIHAALERDGSATIKNPFGGGAFADYVRTQFEKTWPGESVESWANHTGAEKVLDRKTVHEWLRGLLPRQTMKLGPLTELMVETRAAREGDGTDEQARKAEAEAIERRMRFCLMLDRIGEKLQAWFREDYHDYYDDLACELVRTAQRTYAILTHEEYPVAELAQMIELSAEEPATGQGILTWLILVRNTSVTKSPIETVEQARTLLEQLHTHALAGETSRRIVRRVLAGWLICGAPLPHFRMCLMEPPIRGGWFLDYLALLGNVHAYLWYKHFVITSITRAPMPDGIDRETILRGSLMFDAKGVDGSSLGIELNFRIAVASAPPGTDIHAIISRVNEQFRMAERVLDRHVLSIVADAVPDELLRFDNLDLDTEAPEVLLELAKLCLKRERLDNATQLLAAIIPRAPSEPAPWQLLIDLLSGQLRQILFLSRKMIHLYRQQPPDAEYIGPEMDAAITDLMDKMDEAHVKGLELLNSALEALRALDPNAARQREIEFECEHIFFLYDLHANGFPFPEEEIGVLRHDARGALAAIEELTANTGPDGPMCERMARLYLVLGDRSRAREHAKEADLLGFPEALALLSKSS